MNAAHERECPLNEQSVGWAFHALEPDEEMVVLRHLPKCSSCQAAALEAEQVLGGLGAAVEQIDPPRTLRDSLLSQVAETPQRPPMLRPRTSPEATTQSLPAVRPTPRRPVPPERPIAPAAPTAPARGSWLSRRGRKLVAASLALAGVLTVGGLAVRTTQLTEQRDVEIAQAQTLADIVTQLGEPGSTVATLATPDGAPLAAVLVHDGQRTLVTAGLAPNSQERDTYVVWGIGNGDPRAIATFDVVGTDADVTPVGPVSGADDFSGYAISIEPGRTAPASPSTVVASGQVDA